MAFRNCGFRICESEKGAGKDYTQNKAEERTKKGRPKKALMLNLDFQLPKHPVKKVMAILWNQTTGLPAVRLTIPQPQLLGVLHESPHCMYGSSHSEPCQSSDTRGSSLWLHTDNWTKSGNGNISEAYIVSWHYDEVLPLKYVFRVRQSWDRNFVG